MDVPCAAPKLIGQDPDGEPFTEDWDYCSILSKLTSWKSRAEVKSHRPFINAPVSLQIQRLPMEKQSSTLVVTS